MTARAMRRAGVTLICVLLPLVAQAQWSAKAEAGLVAARGNTRTDSANAKVEVGREQRRWKNTVGIDGVYTSDERRTTGQRWEVRGQTDYKWDDRGFTFASVRYEDDRFSGFEYQTTYATGFGWRFIDNGITSFVVQIGAGYKVFETRAAFAPDLTLTPSERGEDLVAQNKVELEHLFTATTKFLNKFLTEYGEENTSVQNDISLQVKINAMLSLAVGYSVRYNTDPPAGFRTTDTLSTVNLVYELH